MGDQNWEYVLERTDELGMETVFDTRHDAVGFKAIISNHGPDDAEYEINPRPEVEETVNMTEDALWRAEIVDRSGDKSEHVGWTLLYETRSFAADSAYIFMLANHLDEVSVRTMPWYGSSYEQVGTFGRGDNRYPIYIGYDEDGDPVEHDANALQYDGLFNDLTYERV